jgi:F0F1-type ATP synthase membrane subunit c/vacuolar-type H+-ATPase subunit K
MKRQLQILWLALLASHAVYAAIVFLVVGKSAPPEGGPPIEALLIIFGMLSVTSLGVMTVMRRKFMEKNVQTASIFTWAMCESVTIYGLVIAFITQEKWPFFPFAAVGISAMILFRPQT